MAKSVTSMMYIEKMSVWVLLTANLKAREDEFKQLVTKQLQYVRFRHFGTTHLRIICEQYSYEAVEKVVEDALVAMEV